MIFSLMLDMEHKTGSESSYVQNSRDISSRLFCEERHSMPGRVPAIKNSSPERSALGKETCRTGVYGLFLGNIECRDLFGSDRAGVGNLQRLILLIIAKVDIIGNKGVEITLC